MHGLVGRFVVAKEQDSDDEQIDKEYPSNQNR